jgi:hypothetical protein
MKLTEAKSDSTMQVTSTAKTDEVTSTEANYRKAGTKYKVPARMVAHLLKKGMIENPDKKGK